MIVTAGLLPVAGVLMGTASSSADRPASPDPVNVAYVSQATPDSVPEPVAAPAPPPPAVASGAVPEINFEAYQAAADSMAESDPRCHIGWKLIAGIGKVESHHANFGDADDDGQLRTPIYGPVLNGSLAGNRVITDTDGGRLDGNAAYDRAVGPTQFLPSTWKHYSADGNGDGTADPQNLFDAALTTANYLCDEGLDMKNSGEKTQAVLRYNNSMAYVGKVLGFARSY